MLTEAAQQVGDALSNAEQANALAATARLQVEQAGQTLTPIPPTLTAAGEEIEDGQHLIESLRLAAAANSILHRNGGNAETAALLSIRALNKAYSPQADAALVQAVDRLYTRQLFRGHALSVSSAAYSPDGRWVLTGGCDELEGWYCVRGTARLWDAATGEELRQFTGHLREITSVAFSPDGQHLLTGGCEEQDEVNHCIRGTARLWDARTGAQLRQFSGHTDLVTSVAFSPDGQQVLTGSYDGTARLWNVQTGEEVRQFSSPTSSLWSVAFSPDGRFVLTGGSWPDPVARLWDTQTGEELRQFSGHSDAVTSMAFSPDGHYVLTSGLDSTPRLWDTQTGEELRQFTGHTSYVRSVVFSPDGRQILTGSDDGTARLWDTQTGEELRQFTAHTEGVFRATFSPDGRYVLTGGCGDIEARSCVRGTARLWDAVGRAPPTNATTSANNAPSPQTRLL